MGRQVNFYTLPPDLETLEAELRKRGGITLLPWIHKSATVQTVDHLADAGWLVRDVDVASVNLKYVSAQVHWLVDESRSPVIQFHSSGVRVDGTLRPGRLWFETGHYDTYDATATWITKS